MLPRMRPSPVNGAATFAADHALHAGVVQQQLQHICNLIILTVQTSSRLAKVPPNKQSKPRSAHHAGRRAAVVVQRLLQAGEACRGCHALLLLAPHHDTPAGTAGHWAGP